MAARASSKFDEYLKIEKELLEAIEKKKISSRGPFDGTGKGGSNVSYGKVFPTRLLDPKKEAYILDRVGELRSKLSNKA
ncbi:hypothetical protein AB4124_03655 [Paenibacillus sp. 2KB_20]|uniref:hypothetical protein n=1 Tax=Paenibacillus sp. 2KB_20 TaxID=3232977 RepID=UPI003F97CD5B